MLLNYIINHGSPTICGIKIANLINIPSNYVSREEINSYNYILNKHNIHIYILKEGESSSLLYIFNIVGLMKRLNNKNIINFLEKYNYPVNDLFDSLIYLSKRIFFCEEFPHEIGIFLDYPLSDVEKYIINKGKNSLLTGTWKVYDNVGIAKKRFSSFKKCTSFCQYYFHLGFNLENIINIFKGEFNDKTCNSILDWHR